MKTYGTSLKRTSENSNTPAPQKTIHCSKGLIGPWILPLPWTHFAGLIGQEGGSLGADLSPQNGWRPTKKYQVTTGLVFGGDCWVMVLYLKNSNQDQKNTQQKKHKMCKQQLSNGKFSFGNRGVYVLGHPRQCCTQVLRQKNCLANGSD